MAHLPSEWKEWVALSLVRGCDHMEILTILLDNGYTLDQCQNALGKFLPKNHQCPRDRDFYKRLMTPKLVQDMANNNAEFIQTDKAQVIRYDNFLSPEECQTIIELSKEHLRPSEITGDKDEYPDFRTSSTCDLPFLNNEDADKVDQKIINAMGLGIGEDEIIQAQHYDVGQEFKAHTDFFEPATDEYKEHSKTRGQRTWTFMIYLNEACEGGETEFVNLGVKFKPKTGTAIIWNNLYEDGTPNPDTIHHAHPIISGEKVIITKWFRDRNQT